MTIAATNTMKLAEARRRAAKLVVEIQSGVDPKQLGVANMTLGEALEKYLAASSALRPKSVEGYREGIAYLKGWMDRPLREIKHEMVMDRHRDIAKAISLASKGQRSGAATANGAMRALRAVWNAGMHDKPAELAKIHAACI